MSDRTGTADQNTRRQKCILKRRFAPALNKLFVTLVEGELEVQQGQPQTGEQKRKAGAGDTATGH